MTERPLSIDGLALGRILLTRTFGYGKGPLDMSQSAVLAGTGLLLGEGVRNHLLRRLHHRATSLALDAFGTVLIALVLIVLGLSRRLPSFDGNPAAGIALGITILFIYGILYSVVARKRPNSLGVTGTRLLAAGMILFGAGAALGVAIGTGWPIAAAAFGFAAMRVGLSFRFRKQHHDGLTESAVG
jgi:cytochrome c biogenesis factor